MTSKCESLKAFSGFSYPVAPGFRYYKYDFFIFKVTFKLRTYVGNIADFILVNKLSGKRLGMSEILYLHVYMVLETLVLLR